MGVDDDGPTTRRADPAASRSANMIRVGEALAGKYRVEAILGSGGMGTVLRAHHLQLDRDVAIKVMHSEMLAVHDMARRFALEARATAALKSAHTVRILDIDRLPSGAPFIVMELLVGTDLSKLIQKNGPLAVDVAVHYLLQVADAIAEAHTHGIIHRDLKPQNMMLTSEGIVKVLDFGLAKAVGPRGSPPSSTGTATNTLVGSPSYMAPEQIRARGVDARTDIWGLGATLFHFLTGGPPFVAPSLALLMTLITSSEPALVSAGRAGVGPSVDAIIARCLKKNPDERYASIAELQFALLQLRAGIEHATIRDLHVDPTAVPTDPLTVPALMSAMTSRKGPLAEQDAHSRPPATEQNPTSTERAPETEPSDGPAQSTTGGGRTT